MEIIPAIDLMNGRVVRAAGGDRRLYRPWSSTLCPDASPISAVESLIGLFPFQRIYIADLDAIEGRARQEETLAALGRAFPDIEFWLDAGLGPEEAGRARDAGPRSVIGSESLRAAPASGALVGHILSLDYRRGAFLGPASLESEPALWPREVVVMSLDAVGSGGGPDLARIAHIRNAAGQRLIYAAGGVRGVEDIESVRATGAAGALVATALHERRLDADALKRLAQQ